MAFRDAAGWVDSAVHKLICERWLIGGVTGCVDLAVHKLKSMTNTIYIEN